MDDAAHNASTDDSEHEQAREMVIAWIRKQREREGYRTSWTPYDWEAHEQAGDRAMCVRAGESLQTETVAGETDNE